MSFYAFYTAIRRGPYFVRFSLKTALTDPVASLAFVMLLTLKEWHRTLLFVQDVVSRNSVGLLPSYSTSICMLWRYYFCETGTSPSMQERIRQLQEERKCKICLDKLADIVFVPCGHLCSCTSCAPALRKCPICRVKIEKAIRTYVS